MLFCRLLLISFFLVLPPLDSYGNDAVSEEWSEVLSSIRQQYPQVTYISTQALSDWLNDDQRRPPLIIDVRDEKEYQVSHIPDAILVEPKSNIRKDLEYISKNESIVAYCSVGYRSAKMVKKLKELGYQNVQNLEGSIFTWANEGRKLVSNGKFTEAVHPYNERWKKYLNAS